MSRWVFIQTGEGYGYDHVGAPAAPGTWVNSTHIVSVTDGVEGTDCTEVLLVNGSKLLTIEQDAVDILTALDLDMNTSGPVGIADTPGVPLRTEIVTLSMGTKERREVK